MKCRNCGATSSGIRCPVCGHRQFKKAECSVCFTTLFHGQEYCPKCGSPTVYRKTENIKKITPDTIIHSHESHNYNTVSESYNYKEDAYDYNENNKADTKYKKPDVMTFSSIFEPLKNNGKMKYNAHRYQNSIKNKNKKTVPVFLIVFIILLISFLSTAVVVIQNERVRDSIAEFFTSETDDGNVEFDDIILDRNTSQNEYNRNIINDGLSYVYNAQLYVADYNGITVYQAEEEPYFLTDDRDCSSLYINENGIYYKSFDRYIVFKNGERTVLLENVEQCYQLNDDIIYLDSNNMLSIYNINSKITTTLFYNAYNYIVDDVNHEIMVFDENENYTLIDFAGNIFNYNFQGSISPYSCYFMNGKIYYGNYDGIQCYDIINNETKTIYPDLDYYDFAIIDDENQNKLYLLDQSDYLRLACLEDDEYIYYDIFDYVDGFYTTGKNVIFYIYDDDYNRIFYIADNDGNYARLQ